MSLGYGCQFYRLGLISLTPRTVPTPPTPSFLTAVTDLRSDAGNPNPFGDTVPYIIPHLMVISENVVEIFGSMKVMLYLCTQK